MRVKSGGELGKQAGAEMGVTRGASQRQPLLSTAEQSLHHIKSGKERRPNSKFTFLETEGQG